MNASGAWIFSLFLGGLAWATCASLETWAHASQDHDLAPRARPNPYGSVKYPSQGAPRVIGFYSAGCIQGASALPLTGATVSSSSLSVAQGTRSLVAEKNFTYQVMRVSRNRYYGHPDLIEAILQIAQASMVAGSNRAGAPLLIGDLSQPRGGPMTYGHASHQSGIDADLWFWDHPEQTVRELTRRERDELPFVSMLGANGLVDPQLFTEARVHKLRVAAQHPRVQRIFVNPAIKSYLCTNLPAQDRSWLSKLRPWGGHDSHFHIRLSCPQDSPDCVAQAPVPEGDGCEELQQKLPSNPPRELPSDSTALPNKTTKVRAMPAACTRVLKLPAARMVPQAQSNTVPPAQGLQNKFIPNDLTPNDSTQKEQ